MPPDQNFLLLKIVSVDIRFGTAVANLGWQGGTNEGRHPLASKTPGSARLFEGRAWEGTKGRAFLFDFFGLRHTSWHWLLDSLCGNALTFQGTTATQLGAQCINRVVFIFLLLGTVWKMSVKAWVQKRKLHNKTSVKHFDSEGKLCYSINVMLAHLGPDFRLSYISSSLVDILEVELPPNKLQNWSSSKNLMVLPFWRKKKNQKNICFSELENLVCWWSLAALLSHDSNTAWYSCVSCMGTYGNRSLSGYGIWVWVKTIGQQNVDPCPEDRRGISCF